MKQVQIIYASTSGHTEYVCTVLAEALRGRGMEVRLQTADQAQADDCTAGDVLIMASGTWNTGGIEGQLNPHMHEFVHKVAKDADLHGVTCTHIALGDDRYRYTSRAGEHLKKFLTEHGAEYLLLPLVVVNEPYGQEDKILKWAEKFLSKLSA